MKKVIALLVFAVGLTVSANAQVTKAQVEASLKEMNATMDDVVQLYIGNVIAFYVDGTNKRTTEKYQRKVDSDGINKFSLTENGLKISYEKNGVISFVKIIPFSMITTIEISKNDKGIYISIYMIE
jgi:hypothetical protein